MGLTGSSQHPQRPLSARIVILKFVEIHFHLLPGFDDGPQTLEETAWLARTAASDGTRITVATPHVNSAFALDVNTLPERVRQVAERLRRERIPVRVLAGGELAHHVADRLSQRRLECIAQGPPGRRWICLRRPSSASIRHSPRRRTNFANAALG
ncbi:MAG: CpsB/CapC family capsule biosynthesis tyrosine phosphatase [Solirubrobacteraceae bacterium]